jgi:hypothetical protein
MIYISLMSAISLLAYCEILNPNFQRYRKVFLHLALLLIVLLAGLRSEVGTDWNSYFEFYSDNVLADRLEFGFRFFNNLFSNSSISYSIFLLVTNFTCLFLIYIFISRNVRLYFISLAVYFETFLYYNLSAIRQSIALSIVCFGVNYAIRRKPIKFIITILTASLFHTSALIALIMYCIPNDKFHLFTLRSLAIFIFILFGYFALSDAYFLSLLDRTILRNIEYYSMNHYLSENIFQDYCIGLARRFILILLILIYRPNRHKANTMSLTDYNYFCNGYIIGLLIYIFFYLISPDLGVRTSIYFTIFEIVIVSKLIYENKLKDGLIITSIYIFVSWYKMFSIVMLPEFFYHSILDNV